MGKKIKSALELAMEQTAGLKASPEKISDLEQEPYLKAASLLADSFLKLQIAPQKVFDTISRYPEGAREKATRIFLEKAVQGMKLAHCTGIAAAFSLFRAGRESKLVEALEKLNEEHQDTVRKARARAKEGRYQEQLLAPFRRAGISGPALAGVNLERSRWWQRKLRTLEREFRPPLALLKEQLLAALQK